MRRRGVRTCALASGTVVAIGSDDSSARGCELPGSTWLPKMPLAHSAFRSSTQWICGEGGGVCVCVCVCVTDAELVDSHVRRTTKIRNYHVPPSAASEKARARALQKLFRQQGLDFDMEELIDSLCPDTYDDTDGSYEGEDELAYYDPRY